MIDTLTSDMFEITANKNDKEIVVTVKIKSSAPKISTNQCLKMHLVDKSDKILDSISLSPNATTRE
jgi:hypothetical protein